MIKTYGFVTVVRGLSHAVRDSNVVIKRITFDNMEGEYVSLEDYKKLEKVCDDLQTEVNKLKKKPRRQSSRQAKSKESEEEKQ